MDTKTQPSVKKETSPSGLFIEGIVVGSKARYIPPKDRTSSGSVSVRHDIALNPGVAVIEEFYDVATCRDVEVREGEVLIYPKYEMLKPIRVKSEGHKIWDNQVVYRQISRVG